MTPKIFTAYGRRLPFPPVAPPPPRLVSLTAGELHALARILSAEAAEACAAGDHAEADALDRRAADLRQEAAR